MNLKLDKTEQLVQKWKEFGYEEETLFVLPFVPLLQLAWAEGFLQAGERRAILDLYHELGIADNLIYDELILRINERPSEEFFAKANDILAQWLETLPKNQQANLRKFLHLGCLRVATASASIGLTPKTKSICPEEQQQLEQIGNRFGLLIN